MTFNHVKSSRAFEKRNPLSITDADEQAFNDWLASNNNHSTNESLSNIFGDSGASSQAIKKSEDGWPKKKKGNIASLIREQSAKYPKFVTPAGSINNVGGS